MLYINCDIGESYGVYKLADDEQIMPHIPHANVVCELHAADPNHMDKTVLLAKIISWDDNREQALDTMIGALKQTKIQSRRA
jgi:thioredoxin-like negative regulator of GroEL